MRIGKNPYSNIILSLLVLIIITVLSILFFPKSLGLNQDIDKLLHIAYKIRVPEVLNAITVGAALSLSGVIMQIVLDNPLASPFTLGLSSSSAFGAALAIIISNTGVVMLNPDLFALMFSCISIVLLLMLSSVTSINKSNLILIGMAVNYLFNALNTFIQYFFANTADAIYQIAFWTQGSLTNARISDSVFLIILLFVVLVISLLLSKDMSTIQQGDKVVLDLGINVRRTRIILLIMSSALTAFSISRVGIIGFVGLIAPHISRMLIGENPKFLIIHSCILGGILLVIADIISKTIKYPAIIPISSITSICGIIFLLTLLFLRNRKTI